MSLAVETRSTPRDIEGEALAALDAGDRENAVTVLMSAYGTEIFRFCRHLVTDPTLAEDAHQMTFVQAYEGMERFSRRSSLRTWLFGIARHRCLDALKMTRRRGARFEAVERLPDAPSPELNSDDRLTARARSRLLAECLDELRPRIRAAVLLRFQQGLSYPELAEAVGERPATLQARVARALPVLRHCLERKGAV
ncbi:MAG: RNA polymerase sigma factor [Acidobacteriota bacterium]